MQITRQGPHAPRQASLSHAPLWLLAGEARDPLPTLVAALRKPGVTAHVAKTTLLAADDEWGTELLAQSTSSDRHMASAPKGKLQPVVAAAQERRRTQAEMEVEPWMRPEEVSGIDHRFLAPGEKALPDRCSSTTLH